MTGPQGPNVLGAFIAPGETVRISISTTFSQLAVLIERRTFLRSKWGLAAREAAYATHAGAQKHRRRIIRQPQDGNQRAID